MKPIPGDRLSLEKELVTELFLPGPGENPRAKQLLQALQPRGNLRLVLSRQPETNSHETPGACDTI